jgi:hypothetical protein
MMERRLIALGLQDSAAIVGLCFNPLRYHTRR